MDRLDRMDDAEPLPLPPPLPALSGGRDGAPAEGEPSTPDFLAHLVCSPRHPSEAGAAIQRLWELHAEPIAEQVGSKFRNCVPPDFVGNAFGLLWEKLIEGKYDWRRGSFKGWWRTVLTNLARDAWEASRGSHASVPLAEGLDPAAPPAGPGAEDRLEAVAERLAEMREALDGLSGRAELRAQVDYYAFFLIELRRSVVSRLRTAGLLPGLGELAPRWDALRDSQVIDHLLPWRPGEEALAFRPDLHTLLDLWDQLKPMIDQPPHDLGAEAVCARVISTTGEPVTRDVWYNWKRHLRRKLGLIGFHEKWEHLF